MDTIFGRGREILARYSGGRCHYVSFWLGERPFLFVTRPEDVECLLSSCKHVVKPEIVYGLVSRFFGRGLITINGDEWRHHRRVLTPAFHFAVLEKYSGIFTRRAAHFAAQLTRDGPSASGESFDFMPLASTFVTDTVLETAFGLQGGEEHDAVGRREFIHATQNAFQIIADRIIKPWLMVESLFRLSPQSKVQDESDRVINKYAQLVIDLKRRQIEEQRRGAATDAADITDDDEDGVRRKLTFLDLVLGQQQDVLSDQEILNEVRTLIAVQQTSASTLSFIAVCLALHPDVQQRAREEVLSVDAEEGLTPLERLNRLKYVERVIKETLRLYPITPLLARSLSEELVLTNALTAKGPGPATLPAGLAVTLFVFQTHRDPKHWPQPERFDPDRFLPERSVGRHPYAYVPFSAGPRNCIGQRYAMLQMKAVVAALLRTAVLSPGNGCEKQDELDLNTNTFLYIKGGFNVKLRRLREHGC
ncbi:cytochrome P450 4C1-like isoform X2 [Thrips palmi]|nr:cytochrome P450 4C1-like isoform X2 [Thrips palmi]